MNDPADIFECWHSQIRNEPISILSVLFNPTHYLVFFFFDEFPFFFAPFLVEFFFSFEFFAWDVHSVAFVPCSFLAELGLRVLLFCGGAFFVLAPLPDPPSRFLTTAPLSLFDDAGGSGGQHRVDELAEGLSTGVAEFAPPLQVWRFEGEGQMLGLQQPRRVPASFTTLQ